MDKIVSEYCYTTYIPFKRCREKSAEETYATGEIIKTLAQNHAVVAIEHDMEFVKQIAERIVVLHQGEKLAEGSVQEIQNNRQVIEVYLGREKIDVAA
nr:hypothetical protein [Pleurocapsa sp. PCC 7319]